MLKLARFFLVHLGMKNISSQNDQNPILPNYVDFPAVFCVIHPWPHCALFVYREQTQDVGSNK